VFSSEKRMTNVARATYMNKFRAEFSVEMRRSGERDPEDMAELIAASRPFITVD
jgi:hypothetical protein